jgi:hypothetical protein
MRGFQKRASGVMVSVMNPTQTKCRRITIDEGTPGEKQYLVQWDDSDGDELRDRAACIRSLTTTGHAVRVELDAVVGSGGEHAISWAELYATIALGDH